MLLAYSAALVRTGCRVSGIGDGLVLGYRTHLDVNNCIRKGFLVGIRNLDGSREGCLDPSTALAGANLGQGVACLNGIALESASANDVLIVHLTCGIPALKGRLKENDIVIVVVDRQSNGIARGDCEVTAVFGDPLVGYVVLGGATLKGYLAISVRTSKNPNATPRRKRMETQEIC